MTPALGQIVGALLLLFLLVGSGFLVWDGLSAGLHGGAAIRGHEHVRARLAVGIFGFGLAAWILLGMLTHAH